MTELKQQRRVQVGAEYVYADGPGQGTPHVRLSEHKDGGEYGLHVLAGADSTTGEVRLLLPSTSDPNYVLELRCDNPDTAKRVGNLFHAMARRAAGESTGEDAAE